MFKKVCLGVLVIVIVIGLIVMIGGNTDNSQQTSTDENAEQNLNIGETWIVDEQWKLTINSAIATSKRNEFSEKTPAQVVYISYTYENLGYKDSNGIMNGLYFDLEPDGDATVVDESGEVAYSYPNDITTQPQETPIGAKCENAQVCVGLNNKSKSITMNISKYDGNGKQHKVKYTLNIK